MGISIDSRVTVGWALAVSRDQIRRCSCATVDCALMVTGTQNILCQAAMCLVSMGEAIRPRTICNCKVSFTGTQDGIGILYTCVSGHLSINARVRTF